MLVIYNIWALSNINLFYGSFIHSQKDSRLLGRQILQKVFWDIGTAHTKILFLMDNTLLRSFHDPLIYELHTREGTVKGLISVIC